MCIVEWVSQSLLECKHDASESIIDGDMGLIGELPSSHTYDRIPPDVASLIEEYTKRSKHAPPSKPSRRRPRWKYLG
jgi:hypothetical protein